MSSGTCTQFQISTNLSVPLLTHDVICHFLLIVKLLKTKNMMFIDGDFKTGIGNCKYHCSPTCHPGQIDPNKWHYGCTHKAWPQNKYGDFVPFVDCDGDISKCELKGKKFAHSYKRGKSLSLRYAKEKVARLEKEIAEYNERCS